MSENPPALRLYVWNNPYHVNYGGTIAYAVATSEDEAREIVRSSSVSSFGWEPDEAAPHSLDIERMPDRVCDLPYAEIYTWAE